MNFIRKIALHTKNMVLIVLLLYSLDPALGASLTPNADINKGTSSVEKRTWSVSELENQAQLYIDLVTILQKLKVLPSLNQSSSCISLEKIERGPIANNGPKSIGIFLEFKQKSFQDEASDSSIYDSSDGSKIPVCGKAPVFPINPGLDSLSMKQGDSNDTADASNILANNGTKAVVAAKGKKEKGLSRTQVIVIATCSAVIGTFFIIAAALRISSCVKRYRVNRETALNVARRTSSMGLNGSNLSSGNLRRDSSSSKASRQSNTAVKGGGDIQVNRRHDNKSYFLPHNSSPLHSHDHNPLLPVTSMGNCSEGGSSHGSIAFIDEESQSRIKEDGPCESDTGTEDDPLLRKSPDSGSSIDITMADVYKIETESMTSEREIFEPGGERAHEADIEIDSDGLVHTHDTNGENSVLNRSTGFAPKVDFNDANDDGLVKDREITNVPVEAGSTIQDETGELKCCNPPENEDEISIQNNDEPLIANSFVVTVGLNQSDSSISSNPSYQYGNQSEYTAYGFYGNVAYCCPYETTYVPHVHHYFNNASANAESALRETSWENEMGFRGNGLYVEDRSLPVENTSPSEFSCRSFSISNTSSGEPLLPNCVRSRTPSDGNILIYGADNLALMDSGEEGEVEERMTGSGNTESAPNTCRVVSQIIPLAVYNKGADYSSKDADEDKITMA